MLQHVTGLSPATIYRYRVVATSHCNPGEPAEECTTIGPERALGTQAAASVFALLDGRGWEMVSPVDKNGGSIQPPEGIFGGGVFQAAAGGGSLAYSSADSFGANPAGAPPGSQYIARRGGSGWTSENISEPLRSGAYGDEPDGVPFQLFSSDLARGLLLDRRDCASEPCTLGYALRESAGGALAALPEAPGLSVLSASPDLSRIVFESEGSLYEWSGAGLVPIGPPPPNTGVLGTSADGSIVYFQDRSRALALARRQRRQRSPPAPKPPSRATTRRQRAPRGSAADGAHLALPLRRRTDRPRKHYGAIDGLPLRPAARRRRGDAQLRLLQPERRTPRRVRFDPRRDRQRSGPRRDPRLQAPRPHRRRPRVFFDSADDLVLPDTDNRPDVYEWEAQGAGAAPAKAAASA